MALALYRKYRPRTFAEIIGQEHVTEPLSQALRSGRLNHAYLFSGPRGCGKTSSARILARSLNCEQGPTPDPCGVCLSCRSLANDGAGSIDVIEIDAASHGGVDDARELREKAFFAPANSRYKIYVIDEAHMVSSAGFNALLKLVEEPPDYVKFIFATTEPDKVLGTIRSRTHHYPFRLIPPAVLRPYLQQLTDAEGVTVEPSVFPLVVRAGGGSARDSLSILDQLIAGSGPDGVTYSRAVGLLGVTDVTLIDDMCDAIATGDGAAAYATIDRVAEAGHEPRRFASDLLERFRDLIILQQVPDAVAKGLIDGPADQLEMMAGQAARLGAATLSRCGDILHNGLIEMRGTTAPRLLLELVTARMLLPGADASASALLQRLERLEHSGVRGERPAADNAVDAPRPPVGATENGASGGVVGGSGAAGGGGSAGGGAGGGGKAAAMAAAAAARGGSARPAGGGSARPVSPAAPAPTVSAPAAASAAPSASESAPQSGPEAPSDALASASGAPSSPAASGPGSSSGSGAAPVGPGEPDWNQVADGGHPEPGDYDDEPPPWDDEPVDEAPSQPRRRPADPQPAGSVDPRDERSERVRVAWHTLGQQQPKVKAMQEYGIGIRDVEGDTVVFAAPTQALVDRFLNWREAITTEFRKSPGGDWRIRCEVGEAGPPRGPARAGEGRDQSAGRRVSGGSERPAPQAGTAATAPERNSGRTESRPSRPQRPPAADADEDWPAAARPPTAPSRTDRSGSTHASGSPATSDTDETGRSGSTRPGGAPAPLADESALPEAAHPGSSRVAPASADAARPVGSRVVSADDESGWPDPVRPGGSADADSAWPEPARPGGAASTSADADDGWPEPARPGSAAASASSAAAGGHGSASADSWPEPARPGGGSVAANGSAGTGSAAVGGGVSTGLPSSGGGSAGGFGGGSAFGGAAVPAAPAAAPRASAAPASPAPAAAPRASAAPATSAPAAAPAASASPAPMAAPAASASPAAPARSAAMEAARAAARTGVEGASGAAAARAALANARGGGAAPPAGRAAPSRPAGAGGGAARSWSDAPPVEEAPFDPEYDGPAAAYEGFDPGDEPLDEVIDEKTARQSSEEQAIQLLREAFGAEKIAEL